MSNYISQKNIFAGQQTSTTPTNPFTLPYVLYGSNNLNQAIQTKLTDNYIVPHTINPNLLTVGTTGQVLTTDAFGNVVWNASADVDYPVDDNIFVMQNQTDNTKKLMYDCSNITTGTTALVKFAQNLTFPLTQASIANLYIRATDTSGNTDWSDAHSTATFNVFDATTPTKILNFLLTNALVGATNITFNRSLRFPTSNGTSGQVLSTNGTGTLSWITPLSSFVDNTFQIANAVDLTKILNFSASAIQTGTTQTIGFQFGLQFPTTQTTANQILSAIDNAGNLQWQLPKFNDSIFGVFNNTDNTKQLTFNCSAITTSSTSAITFGPSLTFPSVNGSNKQIILNNGAGVWSYSNPSFDSSMFDIYDASDNTKKGKILVSNVATATTVNLSLCKSLALPLSDGALNYFLSTDGLGVTSWQDIKAIIWPAKTNEFAVVDSTDQTKKMIMDNTAITTGQTRTLKMTDYNNDLKDPLASSLILFNGSTNQQTIIASSVAGPLNNYTMILPSTIGTVGQNLQISSVAAPIAQLNWVTPASSGRFTKIDQLTQGTTSWTCPAGVTQIQVVVVGNGGGGHVTLGGTSGFASIGPYAGAGGTIIKMVTVVPATVYAVTIPGTAPVGSQGGTVIFGGTLTTNCICYATGGSTPASNITATVSLGGGGFDGNIQPGNFVQFNGENGCGFSSFVSTGSNLRPFPGTRSYLFTGSQGASIGNNTAANGQQPTGINRNYGGGSPGCMLNNTLASASGSGGAGGIILVYY